MTEQQAKGNRWLWYRLLLWLFILIVFADQWTKQLAVTHLDYGRPVAVVPLLNWTLLHNTGAAFSFLRGASPWFFIILSGAIGVFIVAWLWQLRNAIKTITPVALVMILAGAVGNVIDRLRLGYVIDFVDVYVKHWHWPAFNLADSAIFVGAALLIIEEIWRIKKVARKPNQN
ncbi:MAG: lipoprotein signal peptidase [Gammaproteobacteria bacterium]|nr:lipoprotein signal peptidase [Gammaproteobacteria bacterium]